MNSARLVVGMALGGAALSLTCQKIEPTERGSKASREEAKPASGGSALTPPIPHLAKPKLEELLRDPKKRAELPLRSTASTTPFDSVAAERQELRALGSARKRFVLKERADSPSLVPQEIGDYLASLKAALYPCVERALATNPALQGFTNASFLPFEGEERGPLVAPKTLREFTSDIPDLALTQCSRKVFEETPAPSSRTQIHFALLPRD